MPIKVRLIKRKNLGKDNAVIPVKTYAIPMYSDLVLFKEILNEIAEAGIPSNQVRGVIDRMNHVMRKHLAAGRRVQFGDFGNFRYGVGSTGAATDKEFDMAQMKEPRVIFTPGSELRAGKKSVAFEKGTVVETSKDCDKEHIA